MTNKNTPKAQNSVSTEWPGAFSAFEKAFDAILKNPVPAAAFLLTYVTLAIIGSKSTSLLILASLAQLIFLLAIPLYGLALADDKKPTIKYLLQINPRKYIYLLLATVLYLLIVGVSFLLLIIPVVWALAWTYNVGFLVADKGLSPLAAIKESKRLGANHKGKIWGIVGVSFLGGFGAGLIGSLPYGQYVATFIMGTVTLTCSVAGAMLYRWLQKNNEVAKNEIA